MKLQSTKTVRFEAKELQRLARMTRPSKNSNLTVSALLGFALGTIIVTILRMLVWLH